MRLRAVLVAALLALPLTGCGQASGSDEPAPHLALEVYAAASLQRALAAALDAYATSHRGVDLVMSADASSALAAKIEQGAPADVFLAADTAIPAGLAAAGLAAGGVVPFAANRLAVVVPAGNPARIGTPADLGRPGVRVVACAEGVPLERYTATWVDAVAALPGYGAGFPARYAANVVSREDNAGAVVAKVALGEADAAVVYATDARGADGVEVVGIPGPENPVAVYAGVVVRSSAHPAEAAAFLAWLAGPEGGALLAGFGFLPAP